MLTGTRREEGCRTNSGAAGEVHDCAHSYYILLRPEEHMYYKTGIILLAMVVILLHVVTNHL